MYMLNLIAAEYRKTVEMFSALLADSSFHQKLYNVADVCTAALVGGGKIMLCGNGGSAADSQHLAAELVSRLNYDRPGLSAIALTTDSSALTAISNDYGYQYVFSRQIEALGKKGDVLIVFSTSGSSANVVEAVKAANKAGIITIGFLGHSGREIGKIVEYSLNIPSSETPKIQEAHIASGHILCAIIEEKIFGASYNPQHKSAKSQISGEA